MKILKYKQFILGCLLTTSIFTLSIYGYSNIINLYLYPIILGFLFLLYTEDRNYKIQFSNEFSKIRKYLDISYYSSDNCFDGCKVYYDIKDFLETFRCSNDLDKSDKAIFDRVKIFFDTFGEDLKKEEIMTSLNNEDKKDFIIKVDKTLFLNSLAEIKKLI